MHSVYCSCPKFTVRLMVEGAVILQAAPIVKKFEGQTIGALTSWAHAKFGGPIIVEKLSEYAASRSGTQCRGPGYSEASSSRSSRRMSNSSDVSIPNSSRSAKSISGTR